MVPISSNNDIDQFIEVVITGLLENVRTIYFWFDNSTDRIVNWFITSLSRICLPEVTTFVFNGIHYSTSSIRGQLPRELVSKLFFYNNFPKLTQIAYYSKSIIFYLRNREEK